jgi:predicted transposase YbfD/YdcC
MFGNPEVCFEALTDLRRENKNKIHKLSDIVFLVLAAIISGIEDWVGMEVWAGAKVAWLRKYIKLANGVPSHDTLRAVMSRIKPDEFNVAFTRWVQTELPSLVDCHVAVDGKTLRGSRDEQGTVHMMSAFAAKARVVLTQYPCAAKSNEITAIPDLLSFLELKGAIVTIDAMGCQKNIAKQIIDAEADYVLALKENQPSLYAEVKRALDEELQKDRLPINETIDHGHGRLEIRASLLSTKLDEISGKSDWPGLAAIGVVESIRDIQGVVSTESRYFITSITDPARFQEVVRDHWAIETSQHWVLDVQFGEDRNRTRKDSGAINLALIRRMSLNMLRCNGNQKGSIKSRKIRAGADDTARAEYIFGDHRPL